MDQCHSTARANKIQKSRDHQSGALSLGTCRSEQSVGERPQGELPPMSASQICKESLRMSVKILRLESLGAGQVPSIVYSQKTQILKTWTPVCGAIASWWVPQEVEPNGRKWGDWESAIRPCDCGTHKVLSCHQLKSCDSLLCGLT